jgi:RNA-directed DNA polymerase
MHAVAKDTFDTLDNFAWWRVIRMLTERHHWRLPACPWPGRSPAGRRPSGP